MKQYGIAVQGYHKVVDQDGFAWYSEPGWFAYQKSSAKRYPSRAAAEEDVFHLVCRDPGMLGKIHVKVLQRGRRVKAEPPGGQHG